MTTPSERSKHEREPKRTPQRRDGAGDASAADGEQAASPVKLLVLLVLPIVLLIIWALAQS